MRITVTVVVIMFELTGALTYILPTMVSLIVQFYDQESWSLENQVLDTDSLQIVILVTKAVGDFLGTRGIADEAIRFNGYPILENEDHGFNVSS